MSPLGTLTVAFVIKVPEFSDRIIVSGRHTLAGVTLHDLVGSRVRAGAHRAQTRQETEVTS